MMKFIKGQFLEKTTWFISLSIGLALYLCWHYIPLHIYRYLNHGQDDIYRPLWLTYIEIILLFILSIWCLISSISLIRSYNQTANKNVRVIFQSILTVGFIASTYITITASSELFDYFVYKQYLNYLRSNPF